MRIIWPSTIIEFCSLSLQLLACSLGYRILLSVNVIRENGTSYLNMQKKEISYIYCWG
jgi:hypothetical protein